MLLSRRDVHSWCCSFLFHSWIWACPSRRVKKRSPATSAENFLHLGLLVAAQRRAQDRSSVAAELIGNNVGIAYAKDRKDRRVARLDQCSDTLDEIIGNPKFIFPR